MKTTKTVFFLRAALSLPALAAALTACSCSTETALQRLLGIETAAPVFYGCKTPSEGEVQFLFSSGVKVLSMYFDPPLDAVVNSEGEIVKIGINSALPGGTKVSADILVEDRSKNTLNVLLTFPTRNDRMPDVVINEIRADYSRPKVEFIELLTKTAGNLGGLRVFSAYEKQDEPLYEFPPVEVQAGEYIVIHTRSLDTETGLKDETGASRSASGGTEAESSARDFWIPGAVNIHETNVIYAMNQDDQVIDGIVMKGAENWNNAMSAAAQLLYAQGAWNGDGPETAFDSTAATTTRTICRSSGADSNSAADWYITASGKASPGKVNDPARYTP